MVRVFQLEKQSLGYNSTHCISEKVVYMTRISFGYEVSDE